jgi:hypothetical protein
MTRESPRQSRSRGGAAREDLFFVRRESGLAKGGKIHLFVLRCARMALVDESPTRFARSSSVRVEPGVDSGRGAALPHRGP